MKLKNALYAVVGLLVISMSACVKTAGSTSQPPVVEIPLVSAGDLSIPSTNAYIDSRGTYHVVGAIVNNGNTVITSIELTIEIKDASGISLLKDSTGSIAPNAIIYPMLYTLAPGDVSPFEYSYETTGGMPATYNVLITGQATGSSNRVTLQTENVQLVDDGSGWYFLTGDLVNTGSQWAHINGLAGAVLDDSNKILSADWTTTFTTELAPTGDPNSRDRTPFEIDFPNPGSGTQWHIYTDVNIAENAVDYPIEVKVTNTYFDQFGYARIIGWVTNNSDQSLDSLVVAGLYSSDGTALDASYSFVPVPINPGVAVPFSISSFASVNHNPNLAALVSTYSTRFDPWFTSPTSNEFLDLSDTDGTVQKDGATWTFDGSVTNTSDMSMSGITVVAMVMDSQNKLVAMEYTTLYPTGDAIVPGETNPYSISVYLNPTADNTGYTTSVMVVGDVK